MKSWVKTCIPQIFFVSLHSENAVKSARPAKE